MNKIILLILGLIVFGCTKQELSKPPFGERSRYPHLVKTMNGGLLVSWFEPLDSTTFGLYWSEYSENNWTEKNMIYASEDFFVNWADFPSIFELNDTTLVAHWPEMSSTGTYEYDVKVVYSGDRGSTWCDPIVPHRDGKHAEHGFVSFYKNADRNLGMVWLDGRQMDGGHGHHSAGNMNLYTTSFDGEFGQDDDIPIDAMVCECCPTSAVQVGKATIVAYRDRLESEIRNINIIRKLDDEWEEPYPVFEDGWEIPGCPVNGPKLVEKDGKVAVAWFTAPEGDSRLNVAFSTDFGKSFSNPIRIDDGKPQGRVDLTWINENTIIASLLEANKDESDIVYRMINLDGTQSELKLVETLGGGRGIGYPQIEAVDSQMLVLWTNPEGKTQIQSKWISL